MSLSRDTNPLAQHPLGRAVEIPTPYPWDPERNQIVLHLAWSGDRVNLPSMPGVAGDHNKFLVLFRLNVNGGPIQPPLLDAFVLDEMQHVSFVQYGNTPSGFPPSSPVHCVAGR